MVTFLFVLCGAENRQSTGLYPAPLRRTIDPNNPSLAGLIQARHQRSRGGFCEAESKLDLFAMADTLENASCGLDFATQQPFQRIRNDALQGLAPDKGQFA